MKESSHKVHNNSLHLLVENKFGVLEKVLGVFTLRGFQIENLVYTQNKNSNHADMKINVNCNDQDLEKLIKILHNQICVLEIRLMLDEKEREYTYIALAS